VPPPVNNSPTGLNRENKTDGDESSLSAVGVNSVSSTNEFDYLSVFLRRRVGAGFAKHCDYNV